MIFIGEHAFLFSIQFYEYGATTVAKVSCSKIWKVIKYDKCVLAPYFALPTLPTLLTLPYTLLDAVYYKFCFV